MTKVRVTVPPPAITPIPPPTHTYTPISRLLEAVELIRLALGSPPPLQELELSTLDEASRLLPHPFHLIPDGQEIITASLDAHFESRHLSAV